MLQWHIEALAVAGVTEIVINHAHLGHQIENHFGDGSALGAQLSYSAEATALETAGGIRKALHLLGSAPFLVINGDVACEWPVARALQIAAEWKPEQLAHLVMVPNPAHNPEGDFALQGTVLKQPEAGDAAFTFSGVGVYHPDLFAGIQPGVVAKLAPLLREAMAAGKVHGELFNGFWMDIGTPERLEELDRRLNSVRKH